MKAYQKGVFIFRRDLRLEDNTGLLSLLEQAEMVLPIFIFDPQQVDREKNKYFSEPAFAFLLASLNELDEALQARGTALHIYHGNQSEIIASLIANDAIDAVFVNKDYTPFARTRDKKIADVCKKESVVFERYSDAVLSPIETIRTGQDTLYTVFTPFMKNAIQNEVATPRKNNFSNYYVGTTKTKNAALSDFTADTSDIDLLLQGGRNEALEILRRNDYLKNYKDRRNLPAVAGTSKLSAHHKFGTISIRESFYMAKDHAGLHSHFISELYWRDFYYYIAYHFPIVFKKSFLPWAKYVAWDNNEDHFASWCKGKTGVPMVDAGMRELNQTGWMHNRSRMIVASYLTKNLLIDWHWGEQYFASKLTDYDPSQNNGGWQWSASTGADPRPLRIFNPYTQATNYDVDALYIQRWVPELQNIPAETLTDGKTQDFSVLTNEYPAPIVDQKETYHRAMQTYKTAKEKWKAENGNAEH